MPPQASTGVMFRREQLPERLVEYARRVESAGFDELWLVEDCFYMGGVAQAATALAATSSISIGLGISPAVARNPSFLAMEFATLASLHPGRFHGGIGHGVAAWMEQIGARPDSWLAALEETTIAVRGLLAGEKVNVSGRSVQLRDVQLEHMPRIAPPISLGVRGVKSLRLSGRCADGTILVEGSGPAYVRRAREAIEDGRRAAGVTRSHRVTAYCLCAVSAREPDRARATVRGALAQFFGDGGSDALIEPLPYANELREMIAEGGTAALDERMPDAWVDELAVTGTPEEGAAAVNRLCEAGVDSVVLVPPADTDADAWLDGVSGSLLPILRSRP